MDSRPTYICLARVAVFWWAAYGILLNEGFAAGGAARAVVLRVPHSAGCNVLMGGAGSGISSCSVLMPALAQLS